MLRPGAVFAALLFLLLAGCSGPVWDGRTTSWGTMREVMLFEKTAGRVELDAAAGDADSVGLGALEGLAGEFVAIDGQVWVSRAVGVERPVALPPAAGEQASFAVMARVPAWIEIPVERDVPAADLADFVRDALQRSDLPLDRPTPFMVLGPLRDVRLHVLAGHCPIAHPDLPEAEQPFRAEFGETRGTLVGLYGQGQEGLTMHHGERTHVHALVGDERRIVGHVDAVTLPVGAVLRVPAH